jgi:hypothetical protein
MKLKEALKERIKERITESTGLPDAPSGGNNSARYTPPGQKRTLKVPQLSGYMQVEEPEADDPMPVNDVADGPTTYMDKGLNYQYNNKIRRDADGELTASGYPGDAYANPSEYVDDHSEMSHQDAAESNVNV